MSGEQTQVGSQSTDVVAHTPGPWRAAHTPVNPWWTVYVGETEQAVADVEGASAVVWNDPDKPQAVEANARLIAAAPELYKALRELEEEITSRFGADRDMSPELARVIFAARAALDKTGHR